LNVDATSQQTATANKTKHRIDSSVTQGRVWPSIRITEGGTGPNVPHVVGNEVSTGAVGGA
jgi:hypothetical protein